ncbi:MAG: hypothetical protein DHS20C21_14930 [Gemmatimonadota bacterium]|nr:MAG: hypothetical protein DHS20C21_14930 [Gemmatimonadota bacterium]
MSKLFEQIRRIANRARRRYSIMVMSGPDGQLRQFTLPGILIPLAAGLTVLGLLGGGAIMLDWANGRVEDANVAVLTEQNHRLERQLAEIRATVEQFEERMGDNLQMGQVFRNLANLEVIPEEVQRLGVGGPPSFSELQDEASPSPLIHQARNTLNRLEELNRQAAFQGSKLEEVVEAMGETKNDLAHIPSTSPIRKGLFSSAYGTRTDPFTAKPTMHRGVDFSAWRGTPVYATANGTVVMAGRHGVLGNLVEIDHGNGILTRYGHNSRVLVKVGQRVERGDRIAEVGSTGRSTSPHCHYEIHVNGRHTNPWRYILDGGPRVNAEA